MQRNSWTSTIDSNGPLARARPPAAHACTASPERHDLGKWQEHISNALFPVSLKRSRQHADAPVRIGARFKRIAALSFAAMSGSGLTVQRHSGKNVPQENSHLKLLFGIKGQCLIRQDGREVALSAGQWTAYDPSRAYEAVPDGETIALVFPTQGASLWERFAKSTAGRVQPIRGNALLTLRAMGFCLEGGLDGEHDDLTGIAESISALMRSLARQYADRPETVPQRAPRHLQLLGDLRARLDEQFRDPSLDVNSLAHHLGISRRTLYNVLAAEGQTPHQIILEYRLNAARSALADPQHRFKSVTEIALDSGFPDINHFSRLFRQHFGSTPTACRQAHRY
ncbi:MAG TPA: helix-turn-helix domain-containing protein [Rhodanobacter sp.]